jgi:hypothetical protein
MSIRKYIEYYEKVPVLFLRYFSEELTPPQFKLSEKSAEKYEKTKELFLNLLVTICSNSDKKYSRNLFLIGSIKYKTINIKDFTLNFPNFVNYLFLANILNHLSFSHFLVEHSSKKEYAPVIIKLHEYGYIKTFLLYELSIQKIKPDFYFTFGRNGENILASFYLYMFMNDEEITYVKTNKKFSAVAKYKFIVKGCIDELVEKYKEFGYTKEDIRKVINGYLDNFDYPSYFN